MLYAAIDPGCTGGYVSIDDEGRLISHSVFRSWRDALVFLRGVKNSGEHLVTLEKIVAVGGDRNRVKSLFTFAANYGGWLTLLEVMDISYVLVPPQTWQPKMLGRFPAGESKKYSVAYASRRFPEIVQIRAQKSKEAISDAICLCCYTMKYK